MRGAPFYGLINPENTEASGGTAPKPLPLRLGEGTCISGWISS